MSELLVGSSCSILTFPATTFSPRRVFWPELVLQKRYKRMERGLLTQAHRSVGGGGSAQPRELLQHHRLKMGAI